MSNNEPMEKYGVPPDKEALAEVEREEKGASADRRKCSVCGVVFGECEHTRAKKK
jgi:hypothetical protein